jgi:hypothetical protein
MPIKLLANNSNILLHPMSKIDDAKKILKEFGLPEAQQNEISAYTLMALF